MKNLARYLNTLNRRVLGNLRQWFEMNRVLPCVASGWVWEGVCWIADEDLIKKDASNNTLILYLHTEARDALNWSVASSIGFAHIPSASTCISAMGIMLHYKFTTTHSTVWIILVFLVKRLNKFLWHSSSTSYQLESHCTSHRERFRHSTGRESEESSVLNEGEYVQFSSTTNDTSLLFSPIVLNISHFSASFMPQWRTVENSWGGLGRFCGWLGKLTELEALASYCIPNNAARPTPHSVHNGAIRTTQLQSDHLLFFWAFLTYLFDKNVLEMRDCLDRLETREHSSRNIEIHCLYFDWILYSCPKG